MDTATEKAPTGIRAKMILTWALAIAIGVWGTYLGLRAYSNSVSRALAAIEAGMLRTNLSGTGLQVAQSLRSVVLYVALAWLGLVVRGLLRRQTVRQVISRGWVWLLACGVAVRLLGELLLNPSLFIEIVVGGLQKGFIYALIALGYTMVYGVVRLINFAHGDLFMVGAFASFYTISRWGMHQWPGSLYIQVFGAAEAPGWTLALGVFLVILVSTATSSFLAVVIERVAYKPLRNAPRIAALITAIGVSFFLEYFSALDFSFGPDFVTYERPFALVRWDRANLNTPLLAVYLVLLLVGAAGQLLIMRLGKRARLPPILESVFLRLSIRFALLAGGFGGRYMSLTLLGVGVPTIQIIVMTASVFLVILLQYIVDQTKIGKAMRASAWDKPTARLMGSNVEQVISFTFALGAALAGAASVLYAVAYPQLVWNMGIMPGLRAFVAAVLGGIGSLPGAFVGSLIMGQAEELSAAYISTPMRDAIAFTLLIIVLIVKPTGIFGEPSGEKV